MAGYVHYVRLFRSTQLKRALECGRKTFNEKAVKCVYLKGETERERKKNEDFRVKSRNCTAIYTVAEEGKK